MLKQVVLKPVYKSLTSDVGKEFYYPCLANSNQYLRVTAYFDAKALSHYAKGLHSLFQNRGVFKLIMSNTISEIDYEAVLKGDKLRREILNTDEFNKSFSSLSENEILRLSNLAFLIQHNLIEIRIAIVKNGIFHDKFGLISDVEDNYIYFRGSNNETSAAIQKNYESFEVTKSWDCSLFESEKIDNAKKTFEQLWNGTEEGVLICDLPTAIKEQIFMIQKNDVIQDENIDEYTDLLITKKNESCILISNTEKMNFVNNKRILTFFQGFIDSSSNTSIVFKQGLDYITIRKIIDKINRIATQNLMTCSTSTDLLEFIKKNDLKIESRYKLGIDIKNYESYLDGDFRNFCLKCSAELNRELREQQLWGAFHITNMKKSANFSVPGTGKTSIVYGAFAYLSSATINEIDRIIMIGPKSSFLAWKDEFTENFGSKRKLSYYDIHEDNDNTNDKKFKIEYEYKDKNLILVNYESLPSLSESLIKIIDSRTMLVFDEIHRIKSNTGIRAKMALSIVDGAGYICALTGTPIPNGYQDIHNLLNVLYKHEYEEFFGFSEITLQSPTYKDIKSINDKIFPFYCRTTKQDLNIPMPDEDIIIESNMTQDEQDLFKLVYTIFNKNILELYIRLIQASTNPSLLLKAIERGMLSSVIDEEDIDEFMNNPSVISNSKTLAELCEKLDKTSKYKACIELIRKLTSEGKTVIVWCTFVNTIQRLSKDLIDCGITSKFIYGAVDSKDRESIIKNFKNNEFQVLITNPNTLAESVSLHQICHDAIYLEYTFNLTHMIQSRDRINRLGLSNNQYTRYYYCVLKNELTFEYDSIDLKIYNRLKEKEALMLEAIEGNELIRLNFSDIEDIRALLVQ